MVARTPHEAAPQPSLQAGAGRAVEQATDTPVSVRVASPPAAAIAAASSDARASRAPAETPAEPAVEPASAMPAPVASADAAATTARGGGGKTGGDQGSGANRRDQEGADVAETVADTAPMTTTADASQATKPGAALAPRETGASAAAPALEDPRLEPMRRAADQVTLKFEGEDGLEGRLRISVRGDTVRASILSSDEGTLQSLGGELGTLRRALTEQGFNTARVAVHDTRTAQANGTTDARQNARDGEERRQGEPQRRPGQGRESRQDSGAEQGRRGPREERRSE